MKKINLIIVSLLLIAAEQSFARNTSGEAIPGVTLPDNNQDQFRNSSSSFDKLKDRINMIAANIDNMNNVAIKQMYAPVAAKLLQTWNDLHQDQNTTSEDLVKLEAKVRVLETQVHMAISQTSLESL